MNDDKYNLYETQLLHLSGNSLCYGSCLCWLKERHARDCHPENYGG